ncbi:helix-turn-helix domain-containing protein [Stenotrophomonas geniculata]|jgi:transcriptional regulator with XRE-family HTH domain|uniref:Helix-turn-helix domain-containing protein n=1 Tax=Stenotrophomonas geniculata TaxID=86188 RepID=A0ABW1MZ62_9GAMM
MDAVNQLLDQARIGANLPSDNALAQRMGVTRAVVSNWRQARNPIPDERIAQICAMAKLDGPLWIAMIHAERAQTQTERALWRLMLDRISAAAAVVALVALSLPSLGNAKTAQNQAVSEGLLTHSVYYVKNIPEDAGVPLASITGLAMPSQEKPASPACPSRPGSYGFLHRPIRVLCMTQAIQPQTKPPPATMISSSSKAAPFSP